MPPALPMSPALDGSVEFGLTAPLPGLYRPCTTPGTTGRRTPRKCTANNPYSRPRPAAAEDVVHEAFYGLYRRWDRLRDPARAPQYLRSAVLNGCRTQLRRSRTAGRPAGDRAASTWASPAAGTTASAEADVLAGEDRQALLAAITRLPDRQREVLVLRYYLDEPDSVIAASLGIGASTVRSTLSRALKALGADLREQL
jgi:RNA polymerase sigma factor (sigma-70 family)